MMMMIYYNDLNIQLIPTIDGLGYDLHGQLHVTDLHLGSKTLHGLLDLLEFGVDFCGDDGAPSG
jgi:hypothetical protein